MATMPTPPPRAAKKINAIWGTLRKSGRRIGIYGEGGVGKTTLAAKAEGETVFVDLEGTLYALFGDSVPANVHPAYTDSWQGLLDIFKEDFTGIRNVVIDSITTAEVMLDSYVLSHFKPNKAGFGKVDFFVEETTPLHSLDELGGGGGANAKYQAFNALLMALDNLTAKGINVIIIAHDCAKENEDLQNGGAFRRNEPRLLDPNSGKNSLRLRFKEWLDDLFFVFFERLVSGSDKREHRTGTRLVGVESGDGFVAKSRTLHGDPVNLDDFALSTIIK